MSSSRGSFVFAFTWATSRTSFSLLIASSRAAMDFSRPTKRGTTMWGKTIMSLRGRRGTRNPAGFSGTLGLFPNIFTYKLTTTPPESKGLRRFRLLFVDDDRFLLLQDHFLADHNFLDVRAGGDVVHDVQHDVFQDRPEAAGPRLSLHRFMGNRRDAAGREFELHPLKLEKPLVLLGQGVPGPAE